jgi:hypothetical protein
MSRINSIIIFLFLTTVIPFSVSAANLSVSPAIATYEVGDYVTLRILATGDTSLNAISGDILFPVSVFSIESVSKASSILNFWVTEPTFSKSSGLVKFEGVALGGFSGKSGTVVTVNLRANKIGSGKVSFKSGQILANDGEGTDITGSLIDGNFIVKASTKPPVKQPESIKDAPQPIPTLQAPEITKVKKYGAESIVGVSSYPNSQVLVTFVSLDGSKIFVTGKSDDEGGFVVVIPKSLKRGLYSVNAIIIKDNQENSQTSNMLIINVGSLLSDIGWELWSVIIALISTILYLLLRIRSHFNSEDNIHKAIRHEVDSTEKIIHKSFNSLEEEIAPYVDKKDLSTIKKDINEAEKTIDKKIEDIESV